MKIKDLKCCGNCCYRMSVDIQDVDSVVYEYCRKNVLVKKSYVCCPEYKYDNFNAQARFSLSDKDS